MNAKLFLRLSENLSFIHSTSYLHLPHQINQEPIDLLLQTSSAPKKWKVNLNYQEHKTHSESPKSHEPHLNRMIRESSQKIYYFRIPFKNSQILNQQNQVIPELNHYSYSIAFTIRFDDNLVNYSKSNGLDGSNRFNNESYVHLFSVNLESEYSAFEIWLSPNGNLLFM